MFIGNTCFRGTLMCAFLLALFFIVQPLSAAGSGSLKGSVLDKTSGEPLIGANIIIQNTSLGGAADVDGNFEIKLIPVGNWKVRVSCIGYVPVIRDVTIVENETLKEEFKLVAQAIEGEVVTVTAQARGQVQAINQQISSDKIVSIVSEARIQELPDFNAAAAIGRLPGVSTLQSSGEDNKVVIRGLAPQYNAVAIGGISLAATGSNQIGTTSQGGAYVTSGTTNNDRSVDLTMITSYMIQSIEVYKTLTPDMNADALGGYVNMNLREAPSGVHGDFLWQSGYTEKTNNYGNYKAIASISNRFFDDRLGVYVLADGEQYDRNSDNMNAQYAITNHDIGANGYETVDVQNIALNRHIETRKRYGGNVILDYTLPSGFIKSVNIFSRLNSISRDYRTILNYDNKSLDFSYWEQNSNTDLAVNSLELQNDFGFMSANLKAANSYSANNSPNSPFYQFSQTSGVTKAPDNTIPDSLTTLASFLGANNTLLNTLSLFETHYKEVNQTYKGDFKIPFRVSAFSGYFKFGGEYQHKENSTDQNTPYTNLSLGGGAINNLEVTSTLINFPQLKFDSTKNRFAAYNFPSPDSTKLLNSFLGGRFGKLFWVPDPRVLNAILHMIAEDPAYNGNQNGGWQNGRYQTMPNDYDYIENYYATYLMAELDFGSALSIIGGARYEEDHMSYFAHNLDDKRNPSPLVQTYRDTTVYPKNHYLLPMVQAKYNLADWSDIRYSYSQTLARPSYTQLSPHYSMDYSESNINAGNPNLKPAHSYNHDLYLTFHSNDLGLLSIGGFYKTISDFSYSTQYYLLANNPAGFFNLTSFFPTPKNQANIYTFINTPYDAFVKGIEADFQTRFWYLPAPFNGVVLSINYTHISSKATYPYMDIRTIRNPNGNNPRFITFLLDSTRTGRLINQPNDLGNASIGYDYKGFSGRVSFNFVGNAVSGIGNFPEQDGFTKNYYRVDASIRQMLPWAGLQLFLDIQNINDANNISTQQSIGGFTSENNYGLVANLGVRFTL
ncbi:MAG: TonB-dependent receptor [Bacteroidota bacterium]|jgi:TonB-dependent receptor